MGPRAAADKNDHACRGRPGSSLSWWRTHREASVQSCVYPRRYTVKTAPCTRTESNLTSSKTIKQNYLLQSIYIDEEHVNLQTFPEPQERSYSFADSVSPFRQVWYVSQGFVDAPWGYGRHIPINQAGRGLALAVALAISLAGWGLASPLRAEAALRAHHELFVGFAQLGVAQQEEPRVFLRERARLA